MSETPPRLTDVSDDMLLRDLLRAGRAERPTAARLDAIASRAAAAVATTAPATVAAGAGSKALALKILGFLALVAGAIVVGLLAGRARGHGAQETALVQSVAARPSVSSAAPSDVAAATDATTAPAPPSASATTTAQPSTAKSTTAPPPELELLHQAEAALATNPKHALELTEEHRRFYPSGALVQEREIIAIDALVRMGARAQARARAKRFATSFPDSPYLVRLDMILGEDP